VPEPAKPAKTVRREKTQPEKIDSKYLSAARELRDRYLEHVNADGAILLRGKYDVGRALDGPAPAPATPALPASHITVAHPGEFNRAA
jgi:hypothetical protein